ncbi:hypothetical protein ES705_30626 [subsurface metagenome]
MIDEFVINLECVKRIYEMPDENMEYHRHEKDPMDHFSQKNIDYLYKVNYEKSTKTLDYPQQVYEDDTDSKSKFTKGKRKEKKIGRNDPCPCGSGKKYKKCCLGKDTV